MRIFLIGLSPENQLSSTTQPDINSQVLPQRLGQQDLACENKPEKLARYRPDQPP